MAWPQRSWMRSIRVGCTCLPPLASTAVGRAHAQQRRLAGAERHGEHRQQVVVDAEALGVLDDQRHAHVLRQPHGHLVARLLDAEPQRRGPERGGAVVVLGLPDLLAGALVDLDRRVEHDAGRLVAVVERRRVDQRLEGRARLALGLQGAVELAGGEGEAADHRVHAAGVRVHGDEPAADLGDLHQRPGAGRLGRVLGRHPDDVAGAEHVGHRLGRCAARARPPAPPRRGSPPPRGPPPGCRPPGAPGAGPPPPWSSAPPGRRRGARAPGRPATSMPVSAAPQSPAMSIFCTGPRQPFSRSKVTRPSISALRAMRCRLGSSVVRTESPPLMRPSPAAARSARP